MARRRASIPEFAQRQGLTTMSRLSVLKVASKDEVDRSEVGAVRIASLLPAATEIVCALGLGDRLVGRSHECDFPEEVTDLPVCTSPRYAGDGSSYEIDQKIRAILQEAGSVYRVDADRLDELAPDVLVTQTQCDVCAVSLAQVEDAACQLVRSQPRIVSLEAVTLGGVWRDVERVGEAVGEAEAARELILRRGRDPRPGNGGAVSVSETGCSGWRYALRRRRGGPLWPASSGWRR